MENMSNDSNSAATIHRLRFDGKGLELLKIYLVNMLLTVITLGIYSFWARVTVTSFFYRHTEFYGERFNYHATGLERFLGFLKALLFIIPIIILYVFLYMGLMNVFEESEVASIFPLIVYVVILPAIPFMMVGRERFRLGRSSIYNVRFRFTGKGLELLKILAFTTILTIITLGFYYPWAFVRVRRFFLNNTYYGSLQMRYTGNGKELFFIILKGIFFSIITMGIYFSWFHANLYKYHWNHTESIDGQKFESDLDGADLFLNMIIAYLAIPFTLGIALPWIAIRFKKMYLTSIIMHGEIDLKSIIGKMDEKASALADGFSDVADALDTLGDFMG